MQACQQVYKPAATSGNTSMRLPIPSHRFGVAAPIGVALLAVSAPVGIAVNGIVTARMPARMSAAVPVGETLRKSIDERFVALREYAEEDGIKLTAGSADLLRSFVMGNASRAPAIVYTDGGFFRAIWRNNEGEQAALIFRSKKEVQFVFFALCDGNVNRATGVAGLRDLPSLLKAHAVEHLLKA